MLRNQIIGRNSKFILFILTHITKIMNFVFCIFNRLFEKRYELQELNFFANSYKWGETQLEDLLCPCSDNPVSWRNPGEDFAFVYRLIWGIRLDGDSSTETTAVVKNIRQLRNFALG